MKNAILKWIPLLVLPVLLVPMQARAAAITYDIVFTATVGNVPTAAEFTYDDVNKVLTGSVTWEGITFDELAFNGSLCGDGVDGALVLLKRGCFVVVDGRLFDAAYFWEVTSGASGGLFEFVAKFPTGSVTVVTLRAEGNRAVSSAEGRVWTASQRATSVPEPGTLALLGLGLTGLGFTRRRRKTTQV